MLGGEPPQMKQGRGVDESGTGSRLRVGNEEGDTEEIYLDTTGSRISSTSISVSKQTFTIITNVEKNL